jgi:hypothetical protein
MELSPQNVIAHMDWPRYVGQLHMGLPSQINEETSLNFLVRATADPKHLEPLGRLGLHAKHLGHRFFTINTLENVPDLIAARIWSTINHRVGHDGIVSFDPPLAGFALARVDGHLRAFERSHGKGYVNYLLEVDLGKPWPVEEGLDLKAYFFSEINPKLGSERILDPDLAKAYISDQIETPWAEDRRKAFYVEIGNCIEAYLKEASIPSTAREVVLNISLPPAPHKPNASNAMTWVFHKGWRQQMSNDQFAALQAHLDAALPDMLQRLGPPSGTLRLKKDAVTHCHRADWIEGTRLIVVVAPMNTPADAHAPAL